MLRLITDFDIVRVSPLHHSNAGPKDSFGEDSNQPRNFLAMDIRQSLHYLGEITGTITTDISIGHYFFEILHREMIFGSRSKSNRYRIVFE